MKAGTWSRSLICACLLLGACAKTTITDHGLAAGPLPATKLGKTLLVVEFALPATVEANGEEAARLIRESLPAAGTAAPDTDERLLARARADALDSVLIVRIEDYLRRGNLYLGVAIPPVSWDTSTLISLRVRALDAKTGAVIADVRRDRVRGGLFTLRRPEDLPAEMKAMLASLVER
ncbi:MAG: hypothetical protein K1X51_16230 [Rhodospirillaceae bacterium]|nr:hypothetical protein [Rhodospirillaceae bacterium]